MNQAAARQKDADYLCGDRFTAADLTFASLLSPLLCLPPEAGHGAVLPNIDAFDEEARELLQEMRAHPSGQFATRMYSEERRCEVVAR